jgi:ubiquinone/menaquinone biosynthesis C-methylase UbiE
MTKPTHTSHWPKSREDVERLNDQLAREHPIDDYYANAPWLIRRIQRQRLHTIRSMVGPSTGLRIIEVGSGGGHVLRLFREAQLTAVDVSSVYLDTARRNLVGYDVHFMKGELQELQLPTASFDRVICTEVLEHTTDPSAIISEIRRILTPAGHAVITVPIDPIVDQAKRLVGATPLRRVFGDRIQWGGDHYHLHKWWPWTFEKLVAANFRVESRRFVPLLPLPIHACFKCVPR